MAERLIIQNFAGLNLDIELGRISLFIGPQASGKSVCAKCLYLFRAFVPNLLASAERLQSQKAIESAFLARFRDHFPNLWQAGAEFYLRHESGESFVEIATDPNSPTLAVNLTYSPFLIDAADEMRGIVKGVREKRATNGAHLMTREGQPAFGFSTDEEEFFATFELHIQTLDRARRNWWGRQAFVIAGRAFLATLRNNILSVLAAKPVADPLLREFIQLYETVRQFPAEGGEPLTPALTKLVESIVRGRLLVEGDEDYIELGNAQRVPLVNASSGQQEAFSLLLILLYLTGTSSPYSTLYAEEPEAHLYPESQWALARLMARVYNKAPRPIDYVITTHSPYLLSVFNNLVYAHQVQQAVQDNPNALRRLGRVVPKDERLPLADFRAYALEGGKARSIISAKDGLLVAADLDNVSEKVAAQFDKLLSLEPQAPRHGKAR